MGWGHRTRALCRGHQGYQKPAQVGSLFSSRADQAARALGRAFVLTEVEGNAKGREETVPITGHPQCLHKKDSE